ncbi:polyadenylate-binding protein-interacting protein 1 [Ditylenchus destructor]|nr:polyadenylate-binding protein-interacting protein 1 [Ditylenchus destructor]
MNPNAPPFRPGMMYRATQPPHSTAPQASNSTHGTDFGGSPARPQGRYDPFGYSNARPQAPNYQSPRPTYASQSQYDSPSRFSVNQQTSSTTGGASNFSAIPPPAGIYQQQNNSLYNNPQTNGPDRTPYYGSSHSTYAGGQISRNPYASTDPMANSGTYYSDVRASPQMETVFYDYDGGMGSMGNENGFCPVSGAAPCNLSQGLLSKMQANPNNVALFEIQIGLEQLADSSQEFDTWATAIRDRLMSDDVGRDDLVLASSMILEMATMVPNSQYNFSRLCQFINQSLCYFAEQNFVPELQEFIFNQTAMYNADQRKNLIIFLAELYDKIEVNGGKYRDLADYIIEYLAHLLDSNMNGNQISEAVIKAVIQLFKLVGRFLENDLAPGILDEIFQKLNQICCNSDTLSDSVKGQILALNQLRQNQWGVTNIEQNGTGNLASASTVMIIGPDGNPLSEEEKAFLEESYNDNSPGGSYGDTLEEDNVVEDYEKFLQATAIRAAEKALEKISCDDEEEALGSPKTTGISASPSTGAQSSSSKTE